MSFFKIKQKLKLSMQSEHISFYSFFRNLPLPQVIHYHSFYLHAHMLLKRLFNSFLQLSFLHTFHQCAYLLKHTVPAISTICMYRFGCRWIRKKWRRYARPYLVLRPSQRSRRKAECLQSQWKATQLSGSVKRRRIRFIVFHYPYGKTKQ